MNRFNAIDETYVGNSLGLDELSLRRSKATLEERVAELDRRMWSVEAKIDRLSLKLETIQQVEKSELGILDSKVTEIYRWIFIVSWLALLIGIFVLPGPR